MSGRELRLSARREARRQAADDQALTDEDIQNLDAYAEKLDEATALIREEISAINQGQLEVVNTLYTRKAELLKWLELRAPVVEPFLLKGIAQDRELPAKLALFKTVLQEDSELLKRMAGVAASIAREIEKVLNRDSLDGLYGKTGEKLSKANDARLKLDHQI